MEQIKTLYQKLEEIRTANPKSNELKSAIDILRSLVENKVASNDSIYKVIELALQQILQDKTRNWVSLLNLATFINTCPFLESTKRAGLGLGGR